MTTLTPMTVEELEKTVKPKPVYKIIYWHEKTFKKEANFTHSIDALEFIMKKEKQLCHIELYKIEG